MDTGSFGSRWGEGGFVGGWEVFYYYYYYGGLSIWSSVVRTKGHVPLMRQTQSNVGHGVMMKMPGGS